MYSAHCKTQSSFGATLMLRPATAPMIVMLESSARTLVLTKLQYINIIAKSSNPGAPPCIYCSFITISTQLGPRKLADILALIEGDVTMFRSKNNFF